MKLFSRISLYVVWLFLLYQLVNKHAEKEGKYYNNEYLKIDVVEKSKILKLYLDEKLICIIKISNTSIQKSNNYEKIIYIDLQAGVENHNDRYDISTRGYLLITQNKKFEASKFKIIINQEKIELVVKDNNGYYEIVTKPDDAIDQNTISLYQKEISLLVSLFIKVSEKLQNAQYEFFGLKIIVDSDANIKSFPLNYPSLKSIIGVLNRVKLWN